MKSMKSKIGSITSAGILTLLLVAPASAVTKPAKEQTITISGRETYFSTISMGWSSGEPDLGWCQYWTKFTVQNTLRSGHRFYFEAKNCKADEEKLFRDHRIISYAYLLNAPLSLTYVSCANNACGEYYHPYKLVKVTSPIAESIDGKLSELDTILSQLGKGIIPVSKELYIDYLRRSKEEPVGTRGITIFCNTGMLSYDGYNRAFFIDDHQGVAMTSITDDKGKTSINELSLVGDQVMLSTYELSAFDTLRVASFFPIQKMKNAYDSAINTGKSMVDRAKRTIGMEARSDQQINNSLCSFVGKIRNMKPVQDKEANRDLAEDYFFDIFRVTER